MNQAAVEAIVGERIDDIVLVQEEQPTEEDNKIWIPDEDIVENEVPTYEEFSELKSAIEDLEAGSLSALGAAAGQVPTADGQGSWTWNTTHQESGANPVIVALAGHRYICGEVSTLTITVPASGCIDVVFESGSTPTVLTIAPPNGVTVEWSNGFDPTNLKSNVAYEIIIKDGRFGRANIYGGFGPTLTVLWEGDAAANQPIDLGISWRSYDFLVLTCNISGNPMYPFSTLVDTTQLATGRTYYGTTAFESPTVYASSAFYMTSDNTIRLVSMAQTWGTAHLAKIVGVKL